jgi:hypothetical protein
MTARRRNPPRRAIVACEDHDHFHEMEKSMSSIPNSAMPHATEASLEPQTQSEEGSGTTLKERAGKLASSAADLARDNPKTAIAAGAALFAGAVAAAAIPAVRARKSGSSGSGGSKSGGSSKKKG